VPDDVIYNVITDPDFGIADSVLNDSNGKQRGASTIERYALRQLSQAKECVIDPWLAELNSSFAVIQNVGGKCRIVEEQEDATLEGRSTLTFQSFGDFKNAYCNQFTKGTNAKGDEIKVPVGAWWITHPMRRQYKRIVFAPERDVPNAYNLWKGFACEALPGDCTLFLAHLKENLCQGNQTYYKYLLGWMASAVQHPASPGHAAVVLRGRKGTGKSFFGTQFGRLFGRHFLAISQSSHLVGNFNAHLRDAVVVLADEALFAGDKKHESVLKTLITEEMIQIEAKGLDTEACPNFVHLIMASNEDWVVPATEGERRYFVLDVSPKRAQDTTYFSEIEKQMRNGGYEALLHMLMNYDLSDFQVRAVPATKGLADQQALGYDSKAQWWNERLLSGIIGGRTWPEVLPVRRMNEDYLEHAKQYNIMRVASPTALGIFLKKVWGVKTLPRKQFGVRGAREWHYLLPSLAKCRKQWDKLYGQNNQDVWPEPDQVELPLPDEEAPF
jgi:hypothetical protein